MANLGRFLPVFGRTWMTLDDRFQAMAENGGNRPNAGRPKLRAVISRNTVKQCHQQLKGGEKVLEAAKPDSQHAHSPAANAAPVFK